MPVPLTNEDLRRFFDLSKTETVSTEGSKEQQIAIARRMLEKWEFIYEHDNHLYCANVKFWR